MDDFIWQKTGQVLSIHEQSPSFTWMNSHAQNPSPILFDDCIRVYFNTRPKKNGKDHTSFPAYVDIDRQNPKKILRVSKKPVLSLGEKGCFDEFGCMTTSVIKNGDELWMYYVGWTRCISVPYNWAIGLAVSNDNGKHFDRMFKGPIVGAQFNEPYLQNGQFVIKEAHNKWHMWYSTGKDWIVHEGKEESIYVITYAHSKDGIYWHRTGNPIFSPAFKDETQTTPTIFKFGEKYHMLFSFRHSKGFRNSKRGYRLGYACSDDLITWHRDDAIAGIEVSNSGWDSEMICYPSVIEVDNKFHLFYCGNNFGQDGFGHALLSPI